MEHLAKLREGVFNLSRESLKELFNMKAAGDGVVRTTKASYILLGAELYAVKDWRSVMKLMNKRDSKKLIDDVRKFDPRNLTVDAISNASEQLKTVAFGDVDRESYAAGQFLVWAVGMLREADPKSLGDDEAVNARMRELTKEEKLERNQKEFGWALEQSPWMPSSTSAPPRRSCKRRYVDTDHFLRPLQEPSLRRLKQPLKEKSRLLLKRRIKQQACEAAGRRLWTASRTD